MLFMYMVLEFSLAGEVFGAPKGTFPPSSMKGKLVFEPRAFSRIQFAGIVGAFDKCTDIRSEISHDVSSKTG